LDFWYDTPFSLSGLLAATLFLLAFLGLGSLVPFRQRVDQHERWSDGFHVRCALELAPTEIENQVSLYYVRRANENETAGHAQAAEQWYATGFRRFPNNETLLMDYVRFLCRTGDSHAACNYATKALAQPVSDIPRFVRVLDSFACVPLYYHSPELLPLADECSKRALELSPSELTLKGTRGGVLVELGRIAEGTALLQECLEQSRSANDQAISASFLALAALREGNRERAHQLLGQAERILATKPAVVDKVFQRVKAELAR
jgi:Tfp pilus assembly protein PilF